MLKIQNIEIKTHTRTFIYFSDLKKACPQFHDLLNKVRDSYTNGDVMRDIEPMIRLSEFIQTLIEFSKADKTLDTIVNALYSALRSDDIYICLTL